MTLGSNNIILQCEMFTDLRIYLPSVPQADNVTMQSIIPSSIAMAAEQWTEITERNFQEYLQRKDSNM